eukprot:390709-Pleurochrysis_carterae.AAC.3
MCNHRLIPAYMMRAALLQTASVLSDMDRHVRRNLGATCHRTICVQRALRAHDAHCTWQSGAQQPLRKRARRD